MEDKEEDKVMKEEVERKETEVDQRDIIPSARVEDGSNEVVKEEEEKEMIRDDSPSPIVNIDARMDEEMEKEKDTELLDSSSHSWTYHKSNIGTPGFTSSRPRLYQLQKSSMEDPPKPENEEIGLDQTPAENDKIHVRTSGEMEEDERTQRDSTSPICDDFPATPTFSEIDETEWNEGERKDEKMEKDEEEAKVRREEGGGNENKGDQRGVFHSHSGSFHSIGRLDASSNEKVEEKMEAKQRDISPSPDSSRRSRSNIEDEEEEMEAKQRDISPSPTSRRRSRSNIEDEEEEMENQLTESQYYSLDCASEEKTTVDTALPEKKAVPWKPNFVFD